MWNDHKFGAAVTQVQAPDENIGKDRVLAVGAPDSNNGAGGFYVIRMALGSWDVLQTRRHLVDNLGNDKYTGFGSSLCTVGDLNQDGMQELATVSLDGPRSSSKALGRVFVMFLDPSDFSVERRMEISQSIPNGAQIFDTTRTHRFVSGIGFGGDLNGDGFPDLLVAGRYDYWNGESGRSTAMLNVLSLYADAPSPTPTPSPSPASPSPTPSTTTTCSAAPSSPGPSSSPSPSPAIQASVSPSSSSATGQPTQQPGSPSPSTSGIPGGSGGSSPVPSSDPSGPASSTSQPAASQSPAQATASAAAAASPSPSPSPSPADVLTECVRSSGSATGTPTPGSAPEEEYDDDIFDDDTETDALDDLDDDTTYTGGADEPSSGAGGRGDDTYGDDAYDTAVTQSASASADDYYDDPDVDVYEVGADDDDTSNGDDDGASAGVMVRLTFVLQVQPGL